MHGVPANLVKELREKTGGGMIECARALYLRDCDMELAEEYVARWNLAAVMSDEVRFPKWHARCMRSQLPDSAAGKPVC